MENANPLVLQDILDQIIKGMLPLAAIMAIYWYFTHRKANYNKIIVFVIVFSMVMAFFGILG